ncbi:GntR family transcriptional regulator [Companilactobacillus allii]|uniref:GntR family transcriptional regulator n=1 Tax=Companilactobacillus allii TaxID=1847728 RepID=A0A1P8Q583_9LACO|nr:GntR family transcriptional regulator, LSA1692 subfamily [Companilactobacillus allii]APX72979.1 GntR family transcriptional regulator [Companilactobacillus allii]USQ67774.1 GntR family transcriptional regulator [Companilactobacillus allii]
MQNYLYIEIANQIKKDIDNRIYSSHQKLPSEIDLADQFSTSRLTVRKAIETLEKEQVVVKERNKGTYVLADNQKISSGSAGLSGFTEVAKKLNLKVNTKVLSFEIISNYPKEIGRGLQLKEDEMVFRIERLRLIDSNPMTLENLYLRETLLPTLNEKQASESLYNLIELSNSIGYASQELEAIQLSAEVSKKLEVEDKLPAFLAHTITYSVDGYPILYDNSYYRSDKYTFHNILYRKN